MSKLNTKYLGLDLASPVIAGSSGLTMSIDKVKILVDSGVGAIVLKSVFEEEINKKAWTMESETGNYPEATDYILAYTKNNSLDKYLEYIGKVRKTGVPVIASVSCISSREWINFTKLIESAGADALELNMFFLPLNKEQKGGKYESAYYDVANEVVSAINIPVSVKIGPVFTNLLNVVWELYLRKVKGVTMFNKFYEPGINIDKPELVSGEVFSNPSDLRQVLRWVAIVSAEIPQMQISASTGVWDGTAAVKQLLAGAQTVQTVSALYRNGPAYVAEVNRFIAEWADKHGFDSVDDFRGKLNYSKIASPELYERSQFMKYFSSGKGMYEL
ncbi:MAG: dihydroorotate dehydrogenase-like protein [Prevotellaceae bacterium]|jgi:dihydroorotate dehydrogenase (fumarate)|nr:dihydroorotate dehydrogenase-like protein [Prevotellaceae bacterium]